MTRKYLVSLSLLALVITAAALQPIVARYRAAQHLARLAAAPPMRNLLSLPGSKALAYGGKFSARPFATRRNAAYGLAARANDGVSAPNSRPGMLSRSWGSIKRMFL
ncbi:hypothetical protein [Hymenobacter latericus]|uniref:hypothetical protein n=1 Tax=Hymenobacter sp. YIM 151858-1 TaxID=2987688 RepID=UPI002225C419|nr:hypothetical protein [Hymenobacter sp. YIM 151858-1]UYZ59039.1 hypothetical protein OIS50_18515 [Hymenobacter sp. YIM 151858-1]